MAEFTALDRALIRKSHRGKAWITPRPAQNGKKRGDKTRVLHIAEVLAGDASLST